MESAKRHWSVSLRSAGLLALVAGGLWGCAKPLPPDGHAESLRRSVIEGVRNDLAPLTRRPEKVESTRTVGLSGYPEWLVEDIGNRMPELTRMAGPEAYDLTEIGLPEMTNLLGDPVETVALSLEDAIRVAVQNNLELEFARIAPSVSEAQLVQAEAAFDWTLFASAQFGATETPTISRAAQQPIGGDFQQRDALTTQAGVRRALITGGQIEFRQDLEYYDQTEAGLSLSPNPGWQMTLAFQYDQPLLRGFGSDVALAQVRLSRNAEREAVARFKGEMLRTVLEVERAYWQLVQAHWDLLILQRQTERGEQLFNQVSARRAIDATPPQITAAASNVEDRKGNVIRAQNVLRRRSDRLKALLNDPNIPVTSELLLVPTDGAMDAPIRYNLGEAVASAVRHRPEIDQAILSIDNTTIQRVVADNARLPQLDLRVLLRLNALESGLGSAYSSAFDRDFVDAIVGVFFEQPIGNRSAEALLRQRTLERQQAVISLRNSVQQIALEIKNTLDNASTNFSLIEQSRIARISASEALRALQAEKETVGGFTIERLEVEFNRQDQLANSERAEVQAMIDYQISLAELYASMGTLLERNRISFEVRDPEGIDPNFLGR
ncbi:MAG: TolC family protein [Phycisphaerales bacterium]|nr:TolC family protein [Phycisphaerales bacterium]